MASGSKSTSSSKSADLQAQEFAALRSPFASSLQGLFGGGPSYTGVYTAPLGSEEYATLARLGEFGEPTSGEAAAEGLNLATLRGDYLEGNPYLDRLVAQSQRDVLDVFDEEELLDRALFTRAGHSLPESSPFSRARSIATRGLTDELGDISTNIRGGSFEAERQRQQEASGEARALAASRFDRLAPILEAQALPRLVEQLGIDRGLEEFRRRIETLMQALGIAAGVTAPAIASSSKSLTQSGGVGCWCAAVFFGWYTADWYAARRWIFEGWRGPVAWLFRSLYLRFGERAAELLRRSRGLRLAVRPLFLWARDRGRAM